MKVTPYTEGSPQLSSVVGDQMTECIQICFLLYLWLGEVMVGVSDGSTTLRLTSCCVK